MIAFPTPVSQVKTNEPIYASSDDRSESTVTNRLLSSEKMLHDRFAINRYPFLGSAATGDRKRSFSLGRRRMRNAIRSPRISLDKSTIQLSKLVNPTRRPIISRPDPPVSIPYRDLPISRSRGIRRKAIHARSQPRIPVFA